MSEITTYMQGPDGTRARSFSAMRCRVLVSGLDATDEDVAACAESLAQTAHRVELLQVQLSTATKECAELRARLADAIAALEDERRPKDQRRRRIIGEGGIVRVDPVDGAPWMMARRERGWGEFGMRADSWDRLLRSWSVRVTGAGVDEHGPWWSVVHDGGEEATR